VNALNKRKVKGEEVGGGEKLFRGKSTMQQASQRINITAYPGSVCGTMLMGSVGRERACTRTPSEILWSNAFRNGGLTFDIRKIPGSFGCPHERSHRGGDDVEGQEVSARIQKLRRWVTISKKSRRNGKGAGGKPNRRSRT